MAGAPYSIRAAFSDDETLSLSLALENADGTALDMTNLTVEYAVVDDSRRQVLLLTEGKGVTITRPGAMTTVTAAPGSLRPGSYEHGGRMKDTSSGRYVQLFDGPLDIHEGTF